VEQVRDKVVEPAGVADDRVDRGEVGVPVCDELGVTEDRGERRLQLVGDGRDQLAG